jgi:hypothetical protein
MLDIKFYMNIVFFSLLISFSKSGLRTSSQNNECEGFSLDSIDSLIQSRLALSEVKKDNHILLIFTSNFQLINM